MIPYQKEKIDNAICYFALSHKSKARKLITQTYLYKYLAFLDFTCLEKTGIPSLGLTYRAYKQGPVPKELYDNRHKLDTALYRFEEREEGRIYIVPKGKPDLSYFSEMERKEMSRLIEIYANSKVFSKDMSDASHEVILAWKITWNRNPKGIIDYKITFGGNITEKPQEDLTYPEEKYLNHIAWEELSGGSRKSLKME
ncbi:MAG: DUF4065 domain-containing protein [Deltaproteobacteria bacterium]|uniref:DUF4065 domain-containing protein n=1 Tax=Candidatus Zymogenus saltonus TaxID=2844893 RepID=A0A9D8PPY8_9DELT|nr:DUF4065 domain-containing protein [Candidatus Zymogenus saltonus]